MQSPQTKSTPSTHYKGSSPDSKLLEIVRNFDVPVEDLFKAFTTAEAVKVWWWPKDLYTDHVEIKFAEGGKYFFNMKGYEQGGGGMTGSFEEIIPNKRIVMTDHFADDKGNAISAKEAKMPGTWPEVIYITFDFASLGANASRFKLSQQGIPNELQKDCVQGWSQSFDKLEKYLEDRQH